ncbi:MAG TPA: helix-turn-helix transcriptional regulator [Solirubrobacteraceae bacterium]|nr:helix-turn-helix transcriptional regulator [Solirubrobacteraceae bacterium]
MEIERAALQLVGDVYGLLEIDEFRSGLLGALREAVPSNWVSLNEVGSRPEEIVSIVDPPLEARWHEVWAQYGPQNPLVERIERTRDGRVFRFSDVVTAAELHALELYREFYGPIGLEHQIAFTLPSPSQMILGVALSRRENDFSDAERDLLELVRPHLIQAYNNATLYSRLLRTREQESLQVDASQVELLGRGLTRREAQVVRLVASGCSDREVAAILEISHRTVQKHLQRCYAKLGVHDRAQAAVVALTLADADAAAEKIGHAVDGSRRLVTEESNGSGSAARLR